MINSNIKNILIILSILTLGCKDEFLLETTKYKPIMVVDGMISNEEGPYVIKLSLASPLPKEEKEIPLEGCTVTLYENSIKSDDFLENEPGIYVISEDGIQGVIGNTYSISIITPDGKEYNTKPQEMKEPVEIDSLYTELLYHEEIDYPFGLPGYQFYIDTKATSNQENYFLWNMIETYQYTADFKLSSIFDGEISYFMSLGEIPQYENTYRCWKTQNPGYIFTGKTSNLTIPKISHQPLHFVGTDTKRLQERYSVLLKQYSIGEEAYYYWKSIEDQISQENFLVATQPYNITGNIKNINNPNDPVYGYFTVASATQKRVFVDRPNNPFYYEICFVCFKDCSRAVPQFYVTVDLIDDNGTIITATGQVKVPCIDCTFNGGEITKPDFWIDK
ncbi:MAG: DUF4249 family protein [Bacteroidales bacterium]|nr:DUF4249 family protein [Bacteroidales bacterium]